MVGLDEEMGGGSSCATPTKRSGSPTKWGGPAAAGFKPRTGRGSKGPQPVGAVRGVVEPDREQLLANMLAPALGPHTRALQPVPWAPHDYVVANTPLMRLLRLLLLGSNTNAPDNMGYYSGSQAQSNPMLAAESAVSPPHSPGTWGLLSKVGYLPGGAPAATAAGEGASGRPPRIASHPTAATTAADSHPPLQLSTDQSDVANLEESGLRPSGAELSPHISEAGSHLSALPGGTNLSSSSWAAAAHSGLVQTTPIRSRPPSQEPSRNTSRTTIVVPNRTSWDSRRSTTDGEAMVVAPMYGGVAARAAGDNLPSPHHPDVFAARESALGTSSSAAAAAAAASASEPGGGKSSSASYDQDPDRDSGPYHVSMPVNPVLAPSIPASVVPHVPADQLPQQQGVRTGGRAQGGAAVTFGAGPFDSPTAPGAPKGFIRMVSSGYGQLPHGSEYRGPLDQQEQAEGPGAVHHGVLGGGAGPAQQEAARPQQVLQPRAPPQRQSYFPDPYLETHTPVLTRPPPAYVVLLGALRPKGYSSAPTSRGELEAPGIDVEGAWPGGSSYVTESERVSAGTRAESSSSRLVGVLSVTSNPSTQPDYTPSTTTASYGHALSGALTPGGYSTGAASTAENRTTPTHETSSMDGSSHLPGAPGGRAAQSSDVGGLTYFLQNAHRRAPGAAAAALLIGMQQQQQAGGLSRMPSAAAALAGRPSLRDQGSTGGAGGSAANSGSAATGTPTAISVEASGASAPAPGGLHRTASIAGAHALSTAAAMSGAFSDQPGSSRAPSGSHTFSPMVTGSPDRTPTAFRSGHLPGAAGHSTSSTLATFAAPLQGAGNSSGVQDLSSTAHAPLQAPAGSSTDAPASPPRFGLAPSGNLLTLAQAAAAAGILASNPASNQGSNRPAGGPTIAGSGGSGGFPAAGAGSRSMLPRALQHAGSSAAALARASAPQDPSIHIPPQATPFTRRSAGHLPFELPGTATSAVQNAAMAAMRPHSPLAMPPVAMPPIWAALASLSVAPLPAGIVTGLLESYAAVGAGGTTGLGAAGAGGANMSGQQDPEYTRRSSTYGVFTARSSQTGPELLLPGRMMRPGTPETFGSGTSPAATMAGQGAGMGAQWQQVHGHQQGGDSRGGSADQYPPLAPSAMYQPPGPDVSVPLPRYNSILSERASITGASAQLMGRLSVTSGVSLGAMFTPMHAMPHGGPSLMPRLQIGSILHMQQVS
jgi:hypothetical protein